MECSFHQIYLENAKKIPSLFPIVDHLMGNIPILFGYIIFNAAYNNIDKFKMFFTILLLQMNSMGFWLLLLQMWKLLNQRVHVVYIQTRTMNSKIISFFYQLMLLTYFSRIIYLINFKFAIELVKVLYAYTWLEAIKTYYCNSKS